MLSRPLQVVLSLGLIALTLIGFGDLLWGGPYDFLNFDDYDYVRDNPHVTSGLTWQGLSWALTSFSAYNWHPLTWMSLQLDSQLYGLAPRGFHATNLILHAANAVLLFHFLLRSTGAAWPAAAVAALFAVHPLHVESVAWVSERKDVLSTFFWMLTLLAYVRYAERPSVRRYLLVVLCLALGLMSKPMLVTLPCVLLLLDYWPLRRWPSAPPGQDGPRFALASAWRLVLEKIPLLLLAVGCCVLTMYAQRSLVQAGQQSIPFGLRAENALVGYVAYLRQMCWPNDLAAFYLHPYFRLSPGEGLPAAEWVPAGLLLAAVTLLALLWRQRRYLLVGWLWYLGTLVPVLGLVQVGLQARADRYTYIPLIGIFIALSWAAWESLGKRRSGRVALAVATIALLVACTTITRAQVPYWRSSATLCDRALRVSGDDRHVHAFASSLFLGLGETDAAIERAEAFRRLRPDDRRSHALLATALVRKGRLDDAVKALEEALALHPDDADFHKQLAEILWTQGKIPAALTHLAAVARLQPYSELGLNYQGIVLHHQDKVAEAVDKFEKAVRLAPQAAMHHVNLALALEDCGHKVAAGYEYRRALDLNPDWPADCNRLARTLATHPDRSRRQGKEAIRRARAACSVTNYCHPPFLETLAAAYAEAGLFEQAIETANRARMLAGEAGDKVLAERLDTALKLYKAGKPSRSDS
jgi:tetratricopeptide (TPR) repeat protein